MSSRDSIASDSSASDSYPLVYKFEWPGLGVPDTRFRIFNGHAEFQVHSAILKLHSAFFLKFLDSPDKQPAPPTAPFRYEWVSKIESDNKWCLVSASVDHGEDNVLDENDKALFTDDLNKLLRAFYNRPYHVTTLPELERLVELADYYRALPVVSYSFIAAVTTKINIPLLHEVETNCALMLELVKKLRNPAMFRELLIYAINPWHKPRYSDPECGGKELHEYDREMQNAIRTARLSVDELLLKAHGKLFSLQIKEDWCRKMAKKAWTACDKLYEEDFVPMPILFRTLDNMAAMESYYFQLQDAIGKLLTDERMLSTPADRKILQYNESFHVLNLSDEEFLPWDSNQIDW